MPWRRVCSRACRWPVALSRGLNANLLRRWVVEAERTGSVRLSGPNTAPVEHVSRFIPVPLVPVPAEPRTPAASLAATSAK